jgi:hypothetical protein
MKRKEALKLNENKFILNAFMGSERFIALNVEEMVYVKLTERTNINAKNAVVQRIVFMVKERLDAEIATDHHFVRMVKERYNAEIAVDHHFVNMVSKSLDARNVVDHHFVRMVDKSSNAKIAVVHHFADMVKERMDVEIAVDLGLVLILPTNTNARSVPLLVFGIIFNVVLIVCYWIPTCVGDVNRNLYH